jgi:adenosylcobinamide amidohydrolase
MKDATLIGNHSISSWFYSSDHKKYFLNVKTRRGVKKTIAMSSLCNNAKVVKKKKIKRTSKEKKIADYVVLMLCSGLPDFSLYNITKREKYIK